MNQEQRNITLQQHFDKINQDTQDITMTIRDNPQKQKKVNQHSRNLSNQNNITSSQNNSCNTQNDSKYLNPQILKTPITLDEVKFFINKMKSEITTRSVPALIIAAYDYLKLWSLPSRQQKMNQLWQNGQLPPPQLTQQPYNSQHLQPYPLNYNALVNPPPQIANQPVAGMLSNPYPSAPRGRGRRGKGRPPKYDRELVAQHPGENHPRPIEPKTKQDKQRALAQIFLYRGYGINFAKAQVTFPMDANLYYTHMRSILYKGFAKVQLIISTQCKLKTVQSEEHKTVKFKCQLCKCQKWMHKNQLKTFHEYIRSVYNLNPQAVSKGDTVRLYRVILGHWEEIKAKMPQVAMPNDPILEDEVKLPS